MVPGFAALAIGLLAAILVQEAVLRYAGQTGFLALPAIVENYWLLIVMAVAFGGAILSELFQRRGLPVLSEPLERTAALLPLAPAIGFWLPIHSSSGLPLAGNSPALWFFGGLFYELMAINRRSLGYGVLAAVATNLGLWLLWNRLHWGFFEHPQLWLPMVLIGLSVLGVALGIVLRIRSFLFLGVTFLTLVLATLIWHAAFQQQQMWVLWIFCIGLELAILVLRILRKTPQRRRGGHAAVAAMGEVRGEG